MAPWYARSQVLITGASSGIGAALARALAPDVAGLVLVARRAAALEALAAELARPGLEITVLPCDLGDGPAVDALLAALAARPQPVDVLVNNAGLGQAGFFEQSDPAQLQQMLAVNVVALTRLTRALLPGMVQRRRGGVLFVSSGFGLTWMPLYAAYVGTKHFVTAFAEALRAEVAGTGVVITQLNPGPVDTGFEAVAGNPLGQPVPAAFSLGAEACARAGLRAFAARRAMVVPHPLVGPFIRLGAATPRVVLRLVYAWTARRFRARLAAPGVAA